MSGGLDSSSIFCQADQLWRSNQAACPAIVGISHPGAEGTEADERQYIEAIEQEYGVTIDRFTIEPLVGVVEGIDQQIAATEAPLVDYMWGITREVHERANARGARVLLTGHWGDQVFFSSGYLVDIFHQLAWREIRRHTREYVRWFGAGETRVLSRRFVVNVARHHLPHALVPPFKWIRRRMMGTDRPKPWFSDAFLRRALRFAGRPATLAAASTRRRPDLSIWNPDRSITCTAWSGTTRSARCMRSTPHSLFFDRDLLGFLMAIPGEIQNLNGVPRALLRDPMRGVLPKRIRTRTGKADFSYIINRGVAKDVRAISQALSSE